MPATTTHAEVEKLAVSPQTEQDAAHPQMLAVAQTNLTAANPHTNAPALELAQDLTVPAPTVHLL